MNVNKNCYVIPAGNEVRGIVTKELKIIWK